MKTTRKAIWGIVLLLMAFLAACGTTAEETSSSQEEGQSEAEAPKKLRVVTDAAYAPMEFQDKGEVVGFDIDFIKAVAEEAGYELEVEHVGWDPIFVEIESKRADIAISSITITEERKQSYAFSVPYFQSTNKILVPEGSDIQNAENLKGKKVAVQNGTTGQMAMDALIGKNDPNIKKFEDNNLAIMEMESGGADAVVADNMIVEEYAKNNPDKKLKVIEDSAFDSEFYGLLFPQDSELVEEFNKAINAVLDNGTYSEIYQEWFGIEPNIKVLKEQQ
ncbi:basic amino acid ABC transporter substrate-binding protein [Mesobacillus maritimus]|uniref:basic amino acid ABC transporter substrate-binding protein n=1 Tax=Mesobacillus maritimus TaxID=1643336 RepID=UPI00203B6C3D|nr:basic amino acid ABC transporter substrate-binding protein [Mesobacillus maritimus]MCM3585643.1 basic amino acid ABC transporter substrate-binding protein [Mesobacillus maritimus]MCM3669115.1 basic amino acid ABC transporter substrate-binding protein [Mesobacillus maritimus]